MLLHSAVALSLRGGRQALGEAYFGSCAVGHPPPPHVVQVNVNVVYDCVLSAAGVLGDLGNRDASLV